jgi:hypothetical protein
MGALFFFLIILPLLEKLEEKKMPEQNKRLKEKRSEEEVELSQRIIESTPCEGDDLAKITNPAVFYQERHRDDMKNAIYCEEEN